ncbi:MAG: hypothetical protein M9955_13530 [Rhizobiaceae bacterium]|nr:hypothetical protein [Rhizobiaceae bacterium]
MTPKASIEITLTYPVPVRDADGKERAVTRITLGRPRTKHAKRLAAAIGPDLLKGFLADTPDGNIDKEALAVDVVTALASADRLDAITAIVADMCGEDVAIIDDLDLVDLLAVGKAFAGFFPALRSFTLSRSAPE